jgi:hypothetical protein
MKPISFDPVFDLESVEDARKAAFDAVNEYPRDQRAVAIAISLGIYAQAAVAAVGREEAGALIRGAAADAGAVLSIAREKPRRGFLRRVLDWLCAFVVGWLLFEIVRVGAGLIAAWLRGVP